ncbi:uncharacterized protein LOC131161609 [Malania oleifera]|uniref:uncharacterized protein LOC131161609 n=1 Tax=Malania oleifera TaxID=397392 RepID=UPI0025ADFB3F|nr:uncharacterized protein LOC131161609 [Malania oleifera]
MGKRKSQRKTAVPSDFQDDESVSSTLTDQSDPALAKGVEDVRLEDVELNKDSLLDQSLDALFEKRASTREKALSSIVQAFSSNLQHEFAEKNFVTLLHRCLSSIKRGFSKEIPLASRAIGLLALTLGSGDSAHEIFKESIPVFSQALKSPSQSSNPSALVECLAIITFVGENDPQEVERVVQIMWQLVNPKRGSNVVATKPSVELMTATVSASSFLLTIMNGWRCKDWQESVSYFSTLLDKDDRSIRKAAGEALAVIFETGNFEKFFAEAKGSTDGSIHERDNSLKGYEHIQGLRAKILNQVRNLSMEAGNKGSSKKNLKSQRDLFRDILEFLEYGSCPETYTLIGDDPLTTSTWSEMIQLNLLKHFLGGGFLKHMQDNEFLHAVFGFAPTKRVLSGNDPRIFRGNKRIPTSSNGKARTKFLNKQRMLSQERNGGVSSSGWDSEQEGLYDD